VTVPFRVSGFFVSYSAAVASCSALIVTPGATPPVESVTVPAMVASCANAVIGSINNTATTSVRDTCEKIVIGNHLPAISNTLLLLRVNSYFERCVERPGILARENVSTRKQTQTACETHMYFRIAEGIKKPGEVTESRQRD